MIKEHNVGRIIILAILAIFIDSIIVINFLIDLYNTILNQVNYLEFYYSIDSMLILIVVMAYNNIAFHVISESSTTINICETGIKYKTLFTRERTISTQDVKKIVFCNEVIFPRGEYASIIIFVKGFRRVVLISEYTMRKEQYANISKGVKTLFGDELIKKKGKYYKPLLMLLGW